MPAPKNPPLLPCPLLRRFAATLCLVAAALAARADIAVLREKGPHSGSAFSNPGLIADAPTGLKVAMKTADVKIHLRPGDGDTLKADVTADFELEDSSPAELNGQLYLVGFPVTGLSAKIVTIDNFAVTVDGKTPATVLRRIIPRRYLRSIQIDDTTVAGTLDAQFRVKPEQPGWMILYASKSEYRASYIWQHSTHPSGKTHVHVTYTVTLRSQSARYTKSYDSTESDAEVFPFIKIRNLDQWADRYFFFDYVLRSGATWDGTIGRERIEITCDPILGLKPSEIIPLSRANIPDDQDISRDQRGTAAWQTGEYSTCLALENAEPDSDLLIAIPASSIHRPSTDSRE